MASKSASSFFDNWTVQTRKGLLELCILNALVHRERYGYELVKTLVALPGLGVTEGTIYPLLSRLRGHGALRTRLVESDEGPARKYYSLTPMGKRTVAIMNKHFESVVDSIERTRDRRRML